MQEEVMAMQAQQHRQKTQKRSRSDYLRLYVLYPLVWIVVSVILFYVVKIS